MSSTIWATTQMGPSFHPIPSLLPTNPLWMGTRPIWDTSTTYLPLDMKNHFSIFHPWLWSLNIYTIWHMIKLLFGLSPNTTTAKKRKEKKTSWRSSSRPHRAFMHIGVSQMKTAARNNHKFKIYKLQYRATYINPNSTLATYELAGC